MAASLHGLLDDNWTLVCGHCNPGGRVEHILVGPRGVLAIACSALNGRMHCDGARWRRDQFDLYNNLVASDAPVASDPAGDLYAAAARLQQVLLGQTSIQQVSTALVFTHPAATLGRIQHAPLNLVTLLPDLKGAALLQAMAGQPDHRTIDGVVDVIRREHARFMRDGGGKARKRSGLFWGR
ncbi:MAG: NERD domain-containing protein [Pseudomonadota bacterium]|nr:NERD domain-containing protein [Pseudomonadota bacterium]